MGEPSPKKGVEKGRLSLGDLDVLPKGSTMWAAEEEMASPMTRRSQLREKELRERAKWVMGKRCMKTPWHACILWMDEILHSWVAWVVQDFVHPQYLSAQEIVEGDVLEGRGELICLPLSHDHPLSRSVPGENVREW